MQATHPITDAPLPGLKIVPTKPGPGDIVNLHGQPDDVARYGVVRMLRRQDGSYMPVIKTYSRWVKLTATTLIDLGLANCLSRQTIDRLIQCGVIDHSQPSPQIILIDVDSLLSHLERTREPGWWTDERRKAFRLGLPIKV
jgi:hypothetical protein